MTSQYTLENFKDKVYNPSCYDRNNVYQWLVGNQITFEEFDWYMSDIHDESYGKGFSDGYDAGSQNMEQM